MSNLRSAKKTTRSVNTNGLFIDIYDAEVREFMRLNPDPDLISEQATVICLQNERYRLIDDNAKICVTSMKEKYISSVDKNISMTIPLVAAMGSSVLSDFPLADKVVTSMGKNSKYLAGWYSRVFRPSYSINESEQKTDDVPLIPRDSRSIEDVKSFLTDCGVNDNISDSFGSFISKGFELKTGLAIVSSIHGFLSGRVPTSVAGVAGHTFGGWS